MEGSAAATAAAGGNSSSPGTRFSVSNNNSSNSNNNSRRYGINIAASSNLIRASLTNLLQYLGILVEGRRGSQETQQLNPDAPSSSSNNGGDGGVSGSSQQEVTIRIISGAEPNAVDGQPGGAVEGTLHSQSALANGSSGIISTDSSSSSYQRYEIHNLARWIEQIIPFALLLLIFIRQHLQGFCAILWIAVVLLKSNDILRIQTALKEERKKSALIGISVLFMLHVMAIYWWCGNDDLLYPLVLLPPKTIPPFLHALFIIVVNDAMVRQIAMVFKCILLIHYKNSRGYNYRKQGQMLTIIEYLLLLYRALLPTPVWYRFFLNKEYGSFLSSLITGLYLTFKLTSVLGKVQLFFAALRALSCKEMHYGSYATAEQVNAVGDLCAICQEKMHAPILLRCKHIFCEDCASEWFERERTCPLCRALVKLPDFKSYSDGSTSLFFQLF